MSHTPTFPKNYAAVDFKVLVYTTCHLGDVPEEVFAQIVAVVTDEHAMLGPEVSPRELKQY